jgi:prepilin-type N-terminal cleavage/methylation domain-containing protein
MKRYYSFRKQLRRAGYSLAEVMVAVGIIGIATGACVGLTSTMVLQEELAWNGTIAINYQENMSRLWQLGMSGGSSSTGAFSGDIIKLMPSSSRNVDISGAVSGTPVASELSSSAIGPSVLGVMQRAETNLNMQNMPGAPVGANSKTQLVRPTIR